MEPVVERPAEVELQLLTDWSDPDARSRHRTAAIGAIGFNVALIAALALLPTEWFKPPEVPAIVERVTPLTLPPPELTQKAPNRGKVTKEFEVREAEAPRQRIVAPPPMKREAAKSSEVAAASPAPPAPKPAPPPPLPEAPKVDVPAQPPQGTPDAQKTIQQAAPAPPPPQIQAQEKPKLAFESPPPPTRGVPLDQRVVPMPEGTSVRDLARTAAGGEGGTAMGSVVGDSGVFGGQSSSPGNPKAAFQLKSDPGGVDFTPYLTAILVTIKRNWLAVIPESARLGRRGTVALQFAVSKDGRIEKVVIAEYSGSPALDRAAVAGVSASEPLPPLPAEFRGPRIVLQLNFVYH